MNDVIEDVIDQANEIEELKRQLDEKDETIEDKDRRISELISTILILKSVLDHSGIEQDLE